jgi:thiol-disulfide isomerase/thioredoxin
MAATRRRFEVCRPKGLVYGMACRKRVFDSIRKANGPLFAQKRQPLQLFANGSVESPGMKKQRGILLIVLVLLAGSAMGSQPSESSIKTQISGLRDLSDAARPAATKKIAMDIRTLPAGLPKLKLAFALAGLSTEGDPGHDTLQAVADTLAQSLKETPQPLAKDGNPAIPYMELARLARYEGVTTDFNDPMLTQASDLLAADDADVQKADFTLKDLNGKKWTLSALRGKIVMVNFWATWCPPCKKEMTDLDLIYTHYQSQGLVILSLTNENALTVTSYISSRGGYHPPVLLDDGGKVAKQFHVDSWPRSFVFNRDGKLVAESIDMRTQRQFFDMFATAGLEPAGN